MLDALEGAEVPSEVRPVITHCQVMGEDLMVRMAKQGVVANIQPSFVGTDCKWVQERLLCEVQKVSYCCGENLPGYGVTKVAPKAKVIYSDWVELVDAFVDA